MCIKHPKLFLTENINSYMNLFNKKNIVLLVVALTGSCVFYYLYDKNNKLIHKQKKKEWIKKNTQNRPTYNNTPKASVSLKRPATVALTDIVLKDPVVSLKRPATVALTDIVLKDPVVSLKRPATVALTDIVLKDPVVSLKRPATVDRHIKDQFL